MLFRSSSEGPCPRARLYAASCVSCRPAAGPYLTGGLLRFYLVITNDHEGRSVSGDCDKKRPKPSHTLVSLKVDERVRCDWQRGWGIRACEPFSHYGPFLCKKGGRKEEMARVTLIRTMRSMTVGSSNSAGTFRP